MADKVERSFLSVLQDVVVASGVNIAFKEFTTRTWNKISEDKRGELLVDFGKMQAERKKDRKNIDNLLRRHQKAIDDLTESRFVTLLCKIPQDPKEGRRPTLWWLNDMDDKRFEQMLCLLDHDLVLQWIERMRRRGGRIATKEINDLTTLLKASLKRSTTIASGIVQVFRRLNQAAERQAPKLGRIADRLEAARTGGKS
jgi:hypothetical protein